MVKICEVIVFKCSSDFHLSALKVNLELDQPVSLGLYIYSMKEPDKFTPVGSFLFLVLFSLFFSVNASPFRIPVSLLFNMEFISIIVDTNGELKEKQVY